MKSTNVAACLALATTALLGACQSGPGPENHEAMMAKMMEIGTPTADHNILKQMEGKWNAKVTHWMDENAPPQVNDGTMAVTAINEGRIFLGEFNSSFSMPGPDGKMMTMPFTGRAQWAYSVADKQYQATWIDSWSTNIMYSTGTLENGNTLRMVGHVVMPDQAGELRSHAFHEKTVVYSNNRMVSEMSIEPKGGKKQKMMEIVYTR